jgi:hypothetical protein
VLEKKKEIKKKFSISFKETVFGKRRRKRKG